MSWGAPAIRGGTRGARVGGAGHARTVSGGYFLFAQLHPGDYTIGLAFSQAQCLTIHIAGPAQLSISPKGESLRRSLIVVPD